MGRVNVDIDLFCAGCGKALLIEDSAGHHVLVTPCTNCIETHETEIAKRVREEENADSSREDAREKLRKWNEEQAARKQELARLGIEDE